MWSTFWRDRWWLGVSSGALLLATMAAFLLNRAVPDSQAAAGWLYLGAVLPVTLRWGRQMGMVTALVAAVLLAVFTAEPIGSPRIQEWDDGVRFGIAIAGLLGSVLLVDRVNRGRLAAERELATLAERERGAAAIRERERQFATLVENLPDVVFRLDRNLRHRYISPLIERITGRPAGAWLGKTGREMGLPAESCDRFEATCRQVLAEGLVGWLDFTYDGHDYRSRIFPDPGGNGTAAGVLGITEDVTAARQAAAEREALLAREQAARTAAETAERRARFLAEATALLTASLDYEQTLQQVARLAVPALADNCVVDLVGDGGPPRSVAVAHADPDKEARIRALRERFPPDPAAANSPVATALRTRRTVLIPVVDDDQIAAIARDPRILEQAIDLLSRSVICAPLQARGEILGAISFGAEQAGRYGEEDRALAEELARRCAIAIDNARLYRDAQAALRARDEFLASISHDLRTPLGAIIGLTQLVMRQAERGAALDGTRIMQALTTIDRSAARMAAMVDELLDLTRLDAGQPLDLDRRPIDLVALVQECVADYARAASRDRIHVEVPGPALIGTWDRARLERVVSNLLSNAVKYSPADSPIKVTLAREPITPEDAGRQRPSGENSEAATVRRTGAEWAVLTVRDEGVGIPAADLPHIFERFHRGANVAGAVGGIGIGLAASKQIVEQHGGTITLQSIEGAGTTVVIRLPCDPVDQAQPAEPPPGDRPRGDAERGE